MNNQNDKNIEEIIEKALQYLDRGKTPAEILNLFPEHQNELNEILSTVSLFKKEREKIVPPSGLLKQILNKVAESVTNGINIRYLYRKEVQGRPSLNNITTKIHDLMTINWKIWAPLGIIAVVALVIIGYSQFGAKAPQAPIAGETPQAPIAAPAQELPVAVTKPATGNIDDAINAILAGASDDQALFADAEKDAELIAADSQAISDFGQSYNENEF